MKASMTSSDFNGGTSSGRGGSTKKDVKKANNAKIVNETEDQIMAILRSLLSSKSLLLIANIEQCL